ncbi:VanZ family protein [Dinoroseobacter sp. S76]|uniref:VanZ family protein n=1 Tax=Dinoroseobacter sp. S76 TaxID=3415124 RepID=UPI003C7EC007
MGSWVFGYAGLAVVYGTALSLVILGALRGIGRFPGWGALPLFALTCTFAFLTMHPFPDPATLVCPVPSATPQLSPGRFLEAVGHLQSAETGLLGWVMNRTLAATAMNFVICVAIGLAFGQQVPSLAKAALFGCALTLVLELTQLSGLWGLYPCAYRQFNVDDLIMNALGVFVGAGLILAYRRIADR